MVVPRIALIILGVLSIVILFSLPKIVVNNEDSLDRQSQTREEVASAASEGFHLNAMPDSIASIIKNLRITIADHDNKQKIASFADSLAKLYFAYQKYDSAAIFAERVAEISPGVENWERAGSYSYEAFGFAVDEEKQRIFGEKARVYLGKVLEVSPDNHAVKIKMAMTYLSTSNPMRGIGMLREVLEEDPKNEQAIFNMGLLSMQSRQYDKAIERFENLVKLYPGNMQGQFYLGISYLESGKRAQAKAQFEWLQQNNTDPAIQTTVGSYLEELE